MPSTADDLHELQTWMQSSLIHQEANRVEVAFYVAPSEQLTAAQRLAIYQRSYYSRLVECMRGQFKALCYTLGNELFDDFAKTYLKNTPSQSPNLGDLGKQFPDFLQETRPDTQQETPEKWIDFMIAMAQFEWDLYRVFDMEGSEDKIFANDQTPDEHLQFQACFFLHRYSFQVNHYYQEVAAGNKPEIPYENDTFVAFVRTNYQVYIISLSEIQFYFLKFLRKNSLNETIEATCQQFGLMPERVEKRWKDWKLDWIRSGFFILQFTQ